MNKISKDPKQWTIEQWVNKVLKKFPSEGSFNIIAIITNEIKGFYPEINKNDPNHFINLIIGFDSLYPLINELEQKDIIKRLDNVNPLTQFWFTLGPEGKNAQSFKTYNKYLTFRENALKDEKSLTDKMGFKVLMPCIFLIFVIVAWPWRNGIFEEVASPNSNKTDTTHRILPSTPQLPK